jgi:SAM-dependent methyltransferase
MDDYLELNQANWDSRVEHHLTGYDLDRFRSDPSFQSFVVQFDEPRLGDVTGLDIVHLQCHIGTDTMSLERLGAGSVTGVDFSPKAIAAARSLAAEWGHRTTFVESTVDDAAVSLNGTTYDMVYTGIGALCWLPSVADWARTVSALLRPGGRLFLREGHPMLWALDEPRPDGLIALAYPYFEGSGLLFEETKTYIDHEGELSAPASISFNHGLGEIFTALMANGLDIVAFEEHDSVPWCALGDEMVALPNGEWRLRDRPERLAASYTLQARKR